MWEGDEIPIAINELKGIISSLDVRKARTQTHQNELGT